MKKLYQGLVVAAALVFAACSSMDISEAEATAEYYPEGFDVTVYAQLNPVLISLQIRDFVKSANSLTISAEEVAADKEAFSADTASLHVIYVSPRYAGYSEEDWINLWTNTADSIVTKKISSMTELFNIKSVRDDLKTLDAIQIDYEAIKMQFMVFGKTHGWPYRLCDPVTEAANPSVDAVNNPVVYPATKYYCKDASGVTREILQ